MSDQRDQNEQISGFEEVERVYNEALGAEVKKLLIQQRDEFVRDLEELGLSFCINFNHKYSELIAKWRTK